jgi:hypothetical protein
MTISSNRFLIGGGGTVAACIYANNAFNSISSLTINGNYFGQGAAPGASQVITVAIQLTGSAGITSPVLIGNTFSMLSPGTITTAIQLGSAMTGALLYNNTYIGNITTQVANSGVKTIRLEAGSQTSLPSFDTIATTGSKTATFSASNKPGTNNATAPANWLPITCDGATYYIPMYSV